MWQSSQKMMWASVNSSRLLVAVLNYPSQYSPSKPKDRSIAPLSSQQVYTATRLVVAVLQVLVGLLHIRMPHKNK